MRLKQIKLAGFKSFVDATPIPFPTAMTCVVGPNGCGKSNVIDAVRWVLGESSAKNLRGDAMTDVIFNGSTQRKPVSQASVELVFDNSQSRLVGSLADRSEISVKRLVTRDAQSLYFLNGSKCRRRDITDIFLGTGLGPRSYAIIEQGMISRLIESRPQELRVFLEEAAGISRYKERRKETEQRIGHTRDNLARLHDVRDELARNIDKLKRQASVAERYKELKAQERRLKAEVAGLRWYRYQQQLQHTEQQIKQLQLQLDAVQTEDSGTFAELTRLKTSQQQQRQQLADVQQLYYRTGMEIATLEQQLLHQRRRVQELVDEKRTLTLDVTQQLDQQQQDLEQIQEFEALLLEQAPATVLLQEQLEELQSQLAVNNEHYEQCRDQLRLVEQQYFSAKQADSQLSQQLQHVEQLTTRLSTEYDSLNEDASEQLASLELEWRQVSDQLVETQTQLEQQSAAQQPLEAQLQALSQQQDECAQQTKQHQWQLQQLAKQQQNLAQQERALAAAMPLLDAVQVEPTWQLAVAQILQRLSRAQLSDGPEQSEFASVWPLAPSVDASLPSNLQGFTRLADLCHGLVPSPLQYVLAVPEHMDVPELSAPWSAVTPSGCWYGADFYLAPPLADAAELMQLRQQLSDCVAEQQRLQQELIRLESVNATLVQQRQPLLAAQQQLKQQMLALQQQVQQQQVQQQVLAKQLAFHQQQWQQQCQRREQLQQELVTLAAQAEMLKAKQQQTSEQADDCEQQRATLQQRQQQWQLQLSQQRPQLEAFTRQWQQAQLELVALERQLEAAKMHYQKSQQQLQRLQQRLAQLQEQQELLTDVDPEQLAQLQQLMEERQQAEQDRIALEQSLLSLEQQIATLEQSQQGLLQQRALQQQQLEQLKMDAQAHQIRASTQLEQLQQLQVQFKDLLDTLDLSLDDSQLAVQLEKTSEAVGRLGPINLAAIDEFEQQQQRKQYLDEQHNDLTQALETLETAMRKIDKETRQKFKQTFDEVNQGLQQLFPKVFGGGSAYLDLTEEDLLETGVTIMARPPGKKNSTIHLLSGGEKALTALSLVFSIFRLNPAPFCMLDEVDAPLDDANVGRFCNLVREMSATVQFIYISHNKIAMEMAEQLMGVTMQEPGVSRVVAVDVDDAVKMAQA